MTLEQKLRRGENNTHTHTHIHTHTHTHTHTRGYIRHERTGRGLLQRESCRWTCLKPLLQQEGRNQTDGEPENGRPTVADAWWLGRGRSVLPREVCGASSRGQRRSPTQCTSQTAGFVISQGGDSRRNILWAILHLLVGLFLVPAATWNKNFPPFFLAVCLSAGMEAGASLCTWSQVLISLPNTRITAGGREEGRKLGER
jgi:hypothetical protein